MIWGCFAGNKLDPIAFINGTVNNDVYIDTLRDNLLPYLDALAGDGKSGITFQQDNASPPTSKKTRLFLDTATIEHGFVVIEWPPNSSDTNEPNRKLVGIPQIELHKRYSDTATLHGPPHIIRQQLRKRLLEV